MTLWNHLRERMLQHPHQTVSERGAKMTFEELVIFAEALAEKLSHQSCCAVYCGTELANAISLLGCIAAGVTAVPLSFRYGEKHCQRILKHLSPSLIIVDTEEGLGLLEIADSDFYTPAPKPAFIMYTSGTSGSPKGAMLSESAVLTNLQDIAAYYEIDAGDSILIARPLYHSAVLTGEFLLALTKGARIVFCSEPFNPISVLKLMKTEHITAFGATPTLLRLLARFTAKSKPPALRHLVISGECMSEAVGREIADAFPEARIYHVYGLTEACPRVSYLPPQFFREAPDCVGIPLHSVKIQLRDTDKSTPSTKNLREGMLWVKGKNLMTGYYKNPELTRRVLRRGWLCTGDIAEINERGWLKIKGRADDLIIRSGMNIYPREIEDALRCDSRTSDVLVYALESDKTGTQIAMKISGSYQSEDEVRKLCVALLPAYEIPSTIQLVKSIPRNGSGKIVRKYENNRK